MQTGNVTTPFGRRSMTLAMFNTQITTSAPVENSSSQVRWDVIKSIRVAKPLLGITDRSITLLAALLSCHREGERADGSELVVWPSNEALTYRTTECHQLRFDGILAFLSTPA